MKIGPLISKQQLIKSLIDNEVFILSIIWEFDSIDDLILKWGYSSLEKLLITEFIETNDYIEDKPKYLSDLMNNIINYYNTIDKDDIIVINFDDVNTYSKLIDNYKNIHIINNNNNEDDHFVILTKF